MVRKLHLNENNENKQWEAFLHPAYLDDVPYTCACCLKKFPAVPSHGMYIDGFEPDGRHYIFAITPNNRVGNGVNYDPYNLPKEDYEGGIFKVVVSEKSDDEGFTWRNFCKKCWPKLTKYSPEELGKMFKSVEELDY